MAVTPARFIALLNVTVTISRKARVKDGQGGWTESYQEHAIAPGRIRPALTPNERNIGAQRDVQLTHVAYFALGVDVVRDDQLVYLAPNGEAKTLIVRAVREPSEPHHIEVDCEERQQGKTTP